MKPFVRVCICQIIARIMRAGWANESMHKVFQQMLENVSHNSAIVMNQLTLDAEE